MRWPSMKVEVETLICSGKDDLVQFVLYVGDLEPGDEGSIASEAGLTFITRDDRRHLLWHGAEPPLALLDYMEVHNKSREQYAASAPSAEPIKPYRRSRIERGLAE